MKRQLLLALVIALFFAPSVYAWTYEDGTYFESVAGGGPICFNSTVTANTQSWAQSQVRFTGFAFGGWSRGAVGFGCSSNAELNITSITADRLDFWVNASTGETSTSTFYITGYGKPETVTGSGVWNWSYDKATRIVTVQVLHSSPTTGSIQWTGHWSQWRDSMYEQLSLLGLIPIVMAAGLVITALMGFSGLDAEQVGSLVVVTIIIATSFLVIALFLQSF